MLWGIDRLSALLCVLAALTTPTYAELGTTRAKAEITDHEILRKVFDSMSKGDFQQAHDEAVRVSQLPNISASIQDRAYLFIAETLTFMDKDSEALAFLKGIVTRHAGDTRPYSDSRPVPMSKRCRERSAIQRTLLYEREGQYSKAARACEELLGYERKNIRYIPKSERTGESLRVNVITQGRVGDLWLYAGDLPKAAVAYRKALDFLNSNQETARSIDRKANVAGGIYGFWFGKLPQVLRCCDGTAGQTATQCALNIDTPVELGQRLVALGHNSHDRQYLQQGYALLRKADSYMVSRQIPDSLPPTLTPRYIWFRQKVTQALTREAADLKEARN